jgi:heme-binding protein
MHTCGFRTFRRVAGVSVGASLISVTFAGITAPSASAAPDCSPQGVSNTVNSTTAAAQQYLRDHPGAGQVAAAAYTQPRQDAAANIRGYFTAHPQEYYELRGILAPIADIQQQCRVNALPPGLDTAYAEFMAG